MNKLIRFIYLFELLGLLAVTQVATGTTLQATYLFNNTLAAQQQTAPALTAINPLGLNSFQNAIVFGQSRQVYRWDGNASPPSQQAGLSLVTTGLIPTNNYSVEIVFEFFDKNDAWRRILDVQNRTSDTGFYLNPGNHLDVFSVSGGSTDWTNNVFHHVVLTDAPSSTVKVYLDGGLEFLITTSLLNISNPGNLLDFFVDNTVGTFQTEFSDGQVALIRLYDGVLTDSEVSQLARNPFGVGAQVSEPLSVLLLCTGLVGLVFCRGWRWPGSIKLPQLGS